MTLLLRRTLGCALLLGAAACSNKTLDYPGGPAGSAMSLVLSKGSLDLPVGQTVQVGAQLRDSVDNPLSTTVTFSSCSASIVTVATAKSSNAGFNSVADVTGAGLGSSCVIASAAGLADTLLVTTGPAGVTISGPDTVASGKTGQFKAVAVDASGHALSGTTAYDWATSSETQLTVDQAKGLASARTPGSVGLLLRAPGGANAVKTVTIVPGTFAGTLSSAAADPGVVVKLVRAANGPKFDNDTHASVGGTDAYIDAVTPDTLFMAVPATGATGSQTLALVNMAADQIAENGAISVNKANADTYAPGNEGTCAIPSPLPSVNSVMTKAGNVYIVYGGHGTGSAGRSCNEGGPATNPELYFAFSTGAKAVTANFALTWAGPSGSDFDIEICNATYTACYAQGFSGNSHDETVDGVAIPANTTGIIIVECWNAGADPLNFKLHIDGL